MCKPLVPLSALKHFIEHPSHAGTRRSHLNRIPKKTFGRLILPADKDEVEGWGIQFQERLCWVKVSVLECAILAVAVGFAAVWCILSGGRGLEAAFSVAATIVGIGN